MIRVTRERANHPVCTACLLEGTTPATAFTYVIAHTPEDNTDGPETLMLRLCHNHYVALIEAQQGLNRRLKDRCPGGSS